MFGLAVATDMVIEANDLVGGGHHQVKVVRDHKYTAALAIAYIADETIELRLPTKIYALRRFVKDEQLWFAQ